MTLVAPFTFQQLLNDTEELRWFTCAYNYNWLNTRWNLDDIVTVDKFEHEWEGPEKHSFSTYPNFTFTATLKDDKRIKGWFTSDTPCPCCPITDGQWEYIDS